jgi:proteasome accessory factor A
MTGRGRVRLANGREMSALEIQYEYLARAQDFTGSSGMNALSGRVLELWERALGAIEAGNLDKIAREIDWVTKYQLIERYRAVHDLPLSAPRVAQLDLAYHDVRRGRGLYYLLQRRGAVDRVTRDLDILAAKSIPPQATRAKLRGEFIRRAQEKRRDYTVDWVHLKLNDQDQRTVLLKDPFSSVDERVERLIASM